MNIPLKMPDFKPGDLLFFWGHDILSRGISLITWGPSHVAVVTKYQGSLVLAESTTLCRTPCLAQGKRVSGVQLHDIQGRLEDYNGGRVQHYPLDSDCVLCPEKQDHLEAIITDYLGTTYDPYTAALSATFFLKLLPYPDRQSLCCSGLIARIYMVLNRMNWDNPEKYSPAKLRNRLLYAATIKPGTLFHPTATRSVS